MSLRFVWHIFRKDSQRLWWLVLLTFTLLGRFVHFDSLRNSATPDTEEAWLNLLLPLTWSLLLALACLEDPVLGDTPFWTTVPCSWPAVLTAKAVFAVLFVHLPYFAACALILQARGFSPFGFPADLLRQQSMLLVLTLGSLALATVVRNLTQFMIVAIALVTASGRLSMNADVLATQHVREVLAFPVIAVAAIWIALTQYGQRRTAVARGVGIAALVVAGFAGWSPSEGFYDMKAVLSPTPPTAGAVAVRLSPDSLSASGSQLPKQLGRANAAISMALTGLRDSTRVRLPYGWELLDSEGNQYRPQIAQWPGQGVPCCTFSDWRILAFDPPVYQRIRNSQVDIKGTLVVDYYRGQTSAPARFDESLTIAGVIKCSTEIQIRDNPADEGLSVRCESPNPLPPVQVKLRDAEGGREWQNYLSGRSRSSVTWLTWLSPLNRGNAYFQPTDEEHYRPGGGAWGVPREVMRTLSITATPEFPEGTAVVHYDIPNIKLSQYEVKP